jgi:predicted nuclease of predicted toxin-antitoxin system
MRVKLDENLPERLVAVLRDLGHDTDTVVQEGLGGSSDDHIWPEVQEAGGFFITKDLDFSDERRYAPGTHQGVLVVRLSDDRSRVVAERLDLVFATEPVETWNGCLVIVGDHKVRIRRPRPRAT